MSSIFVRPVLVKKMIAAEIHEEQVFAIESNALFGRLPEALYSSTAKSEIKASASFRTNLVNVPQLTLELAGHLQVQCQRCMGAYALPVQQMMQYLLFADEQALHAADGEQHSDQYELLLLPAPESSDKTRQGEIDLAALIEDELLLSIPLFPKHASLADCSTRALDVELLDGSQDNESEDRGEVHSPFAGLDKLLKH